MSMYARLQQWLSSTTTRQLYTYTLAALVGVLVLSSAIVGFYYWKVSSIDEEMEAANTKATEAQELLQQYALVEKQRAAVDVELGKQKTFKISGELQEWCKKVGIENKKKEETESFSYAAKEGNYREKTLTVHFESLSMKQLTELLAIIEQNDRVYIKKLEIMVGKKIPSTIDVVLAIATLEKQAATAETTE